MDNNKLDDDLVAARGNGNGTVSIRLEAELAQRLRVLARLKGCTLGSLGSKAMRIGIAELEITYGVQKPQEKPASTPKGK